MRSLRLFPIAAVTLVGWGALAFGAEYSWAYGPLLVFSVVVAVLGRLASPAVPCPTRALTLALATVFLGGLVQLVPLSPRAHAAVSPASLAVDYRRLYAEATMRAEIPVSPRPSPTLSPYSADPAGERGQAPRSLSIEPTRTALGLAFLAALAVARQT